MAIIDRTYVDNALGTEVSLALAPTSAEFDQYEAQARAVVKSVAQAAGYTVADDSENELVRLATLGQWYFYAGGMRHGLEVPAAIQSSLNLLEAIRTGQLPIPGLTPNAANAVGGVTFSSTTDRPQHFSREKLSGW